MTDFARVQIDTESVVFDALVAGTHGPWVILLHGFPDDPRSMKPLMLHLAAHGYRTLAPWMRGYGDSIVREENGGYSIVELGVDVVNLKRAISDHPVHVVGHDWGAIAAYSGSTISPAEFASLSTLAVPPLGRIRPRLAHIPRQLRNSLYVFLFQLPQVRAHLRSQSDLGWVRRLWQRWSPSWDTMDGHLDDVLETFANGDTIDRAFDYYRALKPTIYPLNRALAWLTSMISTAVPIEVPTLLVAGEEDGCIDVRLFEPSLNGFVGEVELLTVPDAGHFMHLERPEVVHDAIRRWIHAHPAVEN